MNHFYNYMLNQCFGFEKMFIPYFLNYLQMVSRFTDQGICLESQKDFHIYFTNTLALDIDRNVKSILTGKFPVILGNPPYSIKSANKESRISKEIKDYYMINNNPLEEKNLRGLPAEILRPGQWPDLKGNFYINETQYFSNIPRELWDYALCGYPVLYKWLKSRNGSNLTAGDISHFITIARALQLTIRYQKEIDQLYKEIENHLL